MKVTKKIASIFNKKYHFYYEECKEGKQLSDDDIIWLFNHIYRKGYEDAVSKIECAVENVAHQVDKKL